MVDDYIGHLLALAGTGGRGLESVSSSEQLSHSIPLLLRVSRADWTPAPSLECTISTRMGDVVTCFATGHAVSVLAHDPDVLAIEASRPAAPRDSKISLPLIHVNAVHERTMLGAAGEHGD